ncbi:hypothetical protein Pfo_022222 [Paulownia fortunei]|nr:hypothetical protein Pfo_022222 [Paulownia fortunei]
MGDNCAANKTKDDHQEAVMPGFRFHPTDEELLGFYLLRKVEGKSICVELIKQVDIYKYDPWDLPKLGSSVGDKEWYFFCMRGRKYKNSLRPNRVTLTGSGFWKATGIDKPIYSTSCNNNECIGLKKSLVYYRRATAGKGTKTDWMMHEFRLPPNHSSSNDHTYDQEVEVWTLCRIVKRNTTYKNSKPHSKPAIDIKTSSGDANSATCSLESESTRTAKYIVIDENLQENSHFEEISINQSPFTSSSSSLWDLNGDGFLRNGNRDELGSVVEFALYRSF